MLKNMIDGFLLNAKIHSTAFHILVSFLDSLFIQLIKNLTQYFKHIRNNNCEHDNCTWRPFFLQHTKLTFIK